MTQKYQVSWTRIAEIDLEQTVYFIAREQPETALSIFRSIRSKAETLKQHPDRGRYLPEFSHYQGLPFRELVISPWRLVYHIKLKRVEILAFFDSRRDIEEILFERLSRVL